MRAALLLAATTVVANAGFSWRSDGAMLPAMAISPGHPKSPARVRALNLKASGGSIFLVPETTS